MFVFERKNIMNYIVCHYLNGKLVGRWDFGKDHCYAKDHAEYVAECVYQKGKHNIIAFEEHSPLTTKLFSKNITILTHIPQGRRLNLPKVFNIYKENHQ